MERGRRWAVQLLLAVVLAAFVVVCLRLGWWQLQRYNSAAGSVQNLGYTLQWPTFALFAIFMVWRLRKLERERTAKATEATETTPDELTGKTAGERERPRATTPEPDDELAAYNRYLAELNAASEKEQHRA